MALFTYAEAQSFRYNNDTPLASFSEEEIEAAAERVKERFENICGVAFEPTEVTVTLDGTGTATVVLPHTRVSAVSAAEIDDVAVTLADIKAKSFGVLYLASGWTSGTRNVSVTYTHGYAAVPETIKRAALIAAAHEIQGSDLPSTTTSHSDELGSFDHLVPGGAGRWYGIPEVDAVLLEWRESTPAVG